VRGLAFIGAGIATTAGVVGFVRAPSSVDLAPADSLADAA
jgi:hypothetical protein